MRIAVKHVVDVHSADIAELADKIIALSSLTYDSAAAENAAISELLISEFQTSLSDAYELGKTAA